MNIHHIKEWLILSCIAYFEAWSIIFRNRSFTLSRMIVILEKGWILPYLFRFPHLRRPLVVIVPLWWVWWARQQYGSLRTCLLHIPRAQRYYSYFQIRCTPGFQMQSRQARLDPLHGISVPNSSSTLILLWLFLHLHLLVFFSTSLWHLLLELKWLMLSKHHKWFHSSRVKSPFVSLYASWFLVSMYLIWILGSKLILSNNQSSATLWVLDTCLIVSFFPLMKIKKTDSL